jgi:hypothetical protein
MYVGMYLNMEKGRKVVELNNNLIPLSTLTLFIDTHVGINVQRIHEGNYSKVVEGKK